MPLVPGVMCCLCFEQIFDGEHWVDDEGAKWDTHIWCHYQDLGLTAIKKAKEARAANGHPPLLEGM